MPLTAEALALMANKGLTIGDAVEIARAMEPTRVRTKGAERQARYRSRLCDEVTVSDVTVTRNEASLAPPIEDHTPPKTSLRSDSVPARKAWFDEARAAYPKRTGSDPKQPAEEKFYRLVKAASDPEAFAREVIEGIKRYAASRHGEDPRFTKQMVVFFNQGCWKDDHEPAAPFLRGASARASPQGRRSVTSAVAEIHEEMSRGHH